jgi:4a-hydroxytetrahydrobiopterin dehydratase
MPKPERIGAEAACARLPGWAPAEGRDAIVRSLKFKDFAEAFGFMAEIALLAEKADHHPEWSNVYNRVDVLLATHEADGVTQRDLDLAQAIDAAATKRGL